MTLEAAPASSFVQIVLPVVLAVFITSWREKKKFDAIHRVFDRLAEDSRNTSSEASH